ncbi:MAG TPA: hypothetical protein VEI01_18955 [Terriglobales bacterium]|nr:hypothetical protein [Terriglobales bacterium]
MSSITIAHAALDRFSDPSRLQASTLLKQFSQAALMAGVTPATRLEIRPIPETVSSGIPQIDALTGGLPRGGLTEISGPDSSGRTSLLLAALAAATGRQETCALIDASDAFDPHSAAAAGIRLERLLWVRCGLNAPVSPRQNPSRNEERSIAEDPVEQALRAADLLLQSGGFGLLALDLAGVPWKTSRRVPLTTWFRFRRSIEHTSTLLLILTTQPCAQACASLSLRMKTDSSGARLQASANMRSAISCQLSENKSVEHHLPSHARLLEGLCIQAELLRTRAERKSMQSDSAFTTKTAWTA